MTENRDFGKDGYRQQKQQEREEVFGMLDEAMEALSQPIGLKAYADVQSRLMSLSVSNALLVMKQRPDAKMLRTYDEWKEQNISVKKGEKGVLALQGEEYTKEDGSAGRASKVVRLFDISQTNAEGREIRQVAPGKFLREMTATSPVPVVLKDDLLKGTEGFYHETSGAILLRENLPEASKVFVLARELSLIEIAGESGRSGQEAHAMAELSAYLLTKRCGLEPPQLIFPRIMRSFEGKTAQEIRSDLSDAKRAASSIDYRCREYRKKQREQSQEGR